MSDIKPEALEILKNMKTIVANEMLVRGFYVDPQVFIPEMKNSVCGGHKFCAIGSLFAAAGYKAEQVSYGWVLFEAFENNRIREFEANPALKLAYDELNKAANTYILMHEIPGTALIDDYTSKLEQLFEGYEDIDESDLIRIIGAAKAQIEVSV